MIQAGTWMKSLWWLIHKDLLREYRARLVIPAMVLLGVVIALVLQMQLDLPADKSLRMTCGSFWIAVLFAGTLAMDKSFSSELGEGCWQALLLYPVPPAVIYLSKVAANLLALFCLQVVLVFLFATLSDVRLPVRPGGLVLVVVLGDLGIAALGTLLSALTQGIRRIGQLLTVLLMPLALPVVLAASEATRALLLGEEGPECTRWVHLLAVSAVVFLTAGVLVFDHVIEDSVQ